MTKLNYELNYPSSGQYSVTSSHPHITLTSFGTRHTNFTSNKYQSNVLSKSQPK